MLKRIIVSQRVDIIEGYGERRDALDQNWYDFCKDVGLSVLPAPNNTHMLHSILTDINIEGILLTGGNTPVAYGGNAPERDDTDTALIEYAYKYDLPLIGVCRGCQSIGLHFGGTLDTVNNHIAVRHKIHGTVEREVNSFHGCAVSDLPNELEVMAASEDGITEALRHKSKSILGIMWHPEREKLFDPFDIELFRRHYGV